MHSALSEEDEDRYTKIYLPNNIRNHPKFSNLSAKKMLENNASKDSFMLKDMLLAMTLCHHGIQYKLSNENSGYGQGFEDSRGTSIYKDEKA